MNYSSWKISKGSRIEWCTHWDRFTTIAFLEGEKRISCRSTWRVFPSICNLCSLRKRQTKLNFYKAIAAILYFIFNNNLSHCNNKMHLKYLHFRIELETKEIFAIWSTIVWILCKYCWWRYYLKVHLLNHRCSQRRDSEENGGGGRGWGGERSIFPDSLSTVLKEKELQGVRERGAKVQPKWCTISAPEQSSLFLQKKKKIYVCGSKYKFLAAFLDQTINYFHLMVVNSYREFFAKLWYENKRFASLLSIKSQRYKSKSLSQKKDGIRSARISHELNIYINTTISSTTKRVINI